MTAELLLRERHQLSAKGGGRQMSNGLSTVTLSVAARDDVTARRSPFVREGPGPDGVPWIIGIGSIWVYVAPLRRIDREGRTQPIVVDSVVIPGALQHEVMRRRPGTQVQHVDIVDLDPGSPLRCGRDDGE